MKAKRYEQLVADERAVARRAYRLELREFERSDYMGLVPGCRMRQEVCHDRYGLDAWPAPTTCT